jgi:CIC family chloride channel protein
MGVLFAAFLRAPLTSVFMVLEVSGNYSVILPVILANTIAYLISRSLQPVPIFELFTHQDGLYLPSMEEQREEIDLHFEDALGPIGVPVLQGSETVWNARQSITEAFEKTDAAAVLIRCRDGGWYAAGRQELEAIFAKMTGDKDSAEAKQTIEERLGPERTPIMFPDQPLASALPYFRRWPLLPISNRAMRGALEGVLSQSDVLRRYQGT